MDIYSKIT